MSVPEKQIEKYLCRSIRRLHDDARCEKFSSPGRRSVPDRIVTLPHGLIWYVEVKAPGKKASPAQEADHRVRRRNGFQVRVIDTYEEVDNFIKLVALALDYAEKNA